MCPQEGGPNGQRAQFLEPADHPQHLQLGGDGEAVAAFDLDGARPVPDHFLQAVQGLFDQFFFGRVLQAGGRIQDTASASGDLLVAQPPDAVFELPFPAAGEDEVRVRVHPGREKQLPVGIDAQIGPRRSFAHRPEGGDTVALDEQESIGDRRQFA